MSKAQHSVPPRLATFRDEDRKAQPNLARTEKLHGGALVHHPRTSPTSLPTHHIASRVKPLGAIRIPTSTSRLPAARASDSPMSSAAADGGAEPRT